MAAVSTVIMLFLLYVVQLYNSVIFVNENGEKRENNELVNEN